MIWTNFRRDLKNTISRLLSVIIITIIAVLVHTGLVGLLHNVSKIEQDYFYDNQIASYWISGQNLTAGDARDLKNLPHVTAVSPRTTLDFEEKGNSNVVISIFGVSDFEINQPYILQGRLPETAREIFLSDRFAAEHTLSVGDFYEVTLPGGSFSLRLSICGIGKNPERATHANASNPAQDFTRYGYGYVLEDVFYPILGKNCYNQICLITTGKESPSQFRTEVYDILGSKAINVLALEDNLNAYSFMEMAYSLKLIIYVFPVLFYLCALLLMVSTMTRLVENSRQTIGTFKSLGYGDGIICLYYMLYAALIVVIGFTVGAFLGKYLAAPLVDTFATNSDLAPYTVVHDFSAWAQSLFVICLCCFGSTWIVSRGILRQTPAQCLRPAPPTSAKSVFIEKITFIWNRLEFKGKYIIRNTLRNKGRMITCIVGIAFCMGLVFTSFALKDSISYYGKCLSENQNKFDILVNFTPDVETGQYQRLSSLPYITETQYEAATACWFYSEDQLTTSALYITEDTVNLKLFNPYASGALSLPQEGIILETALAEKLHVAEGDLLHLRFLGDATFYSIPVAQVTRYVSGAYIGQSAWRAMGMRYTPTTVYLKTNDPSALTNTLDTYDFVSGWQTRSAVTDAAVTTINNAAMIVYILIVFGGALACVVIYNLGIMSFFEQIRSLATLMVLGFHEKEIKTLQLSENIIFAAAGILLGIPIGSFINYAIIISLNALTLEVATRPISYLLSCGITMAFALAVNYFIGRKVSEIDMLGALKSVE